MTQFLSAHSDKPPRQFQPQVIHGLFFGLFGAAFCQVKVYRRVDQRMVTEDKDGICYQRVSLDDVLPGEEQLRRIEAIADPYAMQPQSIMEEQESRRELYDALKRLSQREQTYLLYRYGFTDGEEHPLIGTAIYFHLTKGRAKKTEKQAMDNLWLELPWWFI